ncbi:SusC/RagA family TonB-linked outer membrane protein [Arenibacter sp. TNZ]|jgi:TonB-linked SusC/RagA family outer membrane protein|uniref:SusC/RagA family TonB-linked outer membrane protein n=1 Tax=Arenibacter TaxID=178469 RepID=UPI000CD42B69|nr:MULTISPECIES: SusC/RagA family TonB-linked outer membrane protein [Arenibacter]MCM4171804.1 SusC/RagA family TonB-linked outer membrane protein [Arenibacter sp. TNZ]
MKHKLIKRNILLFFLVAPLLLLAQDVVKGKITDTGLGDPLPGVNVVIKGTTTGTTSDFDGNYEISVDIFPTTLVFSSLGYAPKEMPVTGPTTLNVALEESATGLEEVVVTGLATSVKRSNSANSVASVSADELTGRTPPQTLDGALAGKFAGAQITAASGAPGGGMSVKLRGVTSINGQGQPLYIIDGVYVNNNSVFAGGLNEISNAAGGGASSTDSQDNASNRIADINPDDIQNIEILKGASASAIYGSRAAAGVIIITTKKGKAGKTKINFSQAVGFNEAVNLLGQRNWTAALAESVYGEGALYTAAESAGRLRDYEQEIYGEKGFITNTNLSISGGSDKTSFFGSFTNNEEDGIVKRTGASKQSLRLNVDHRITDDIKLSVTGNYLESSADRGFFNNDNSNTTIGVSLLFTRPWDYLLPDADGNYPNHPANSSNQIHTRDVLTNNESVSRLIAGGSLDVNLFRNENQSLKMILKAGIDTYTLKTTVFFPRELQFMSPAVGGLDGLSSDGTTQNTDANFSAFLVHNFSTDNELSFTTQAGVTNEQFSQNTVRVTSTGLIASEQNVDQAANVKVDQFRLEQEDAGFFVQEEVNFQDKLVGTIGIRGDKSSNNGDANKLFYYPKASAAVNIHNFDFWNLEQVNQIKVRAAYGEAGNFAPNGALFTTYINSLIDGNVGIITPTTLGDPSIQPERQKELELGLDAGFFNNKVSLELTWYNKKVEDLILQADNEPSSGYSFRWANAGALENKGVEIGLNVNAFDTEDFSWDSGISWFKNKSEITKLTVASFDTQGFGTGLGTFRIEEGKSATQIVGNDENGNVVALGDAEPDFQMSFNNNFKYKDFTLSFLWHWKKGGDNVNLSRLLSDFGNTSADYDEMSLDPSGTLNNGDYRKDAFGAGFAGPFVEDASYLKLREIGLYYNLPENTLQKLFKGNVSNVKIGLSGHNIISIFDYNSYDPEVSNFGSGAAGIGIEVAPFPSSKRFMFHLSIGL